jgi:hypothetical protein
VEVVVTAAAQQAAQGLAVRVAVGTALVALAVRSLLLKAEQQTQEAVEAVED